MTALIFHSNPWLLPLLMLFVLALAIELPYRFAGRVARFAMTHSDAFNVVQAGLLTLSSFVLGLSFAQASSRFDVRRDLVVKEANAIGTTWLRADQLGPVRGLQFRKVLTSYTAMRLAAYQRPGNAQSIQAAQRATDDEQAELWKTASSALYAQPKIGLSLLVQALNDTIDVSAEQLQALTVHVPTEIVVLTLILVTLGALSLGLRFAMDKVRPTGLSAVYVVASVVVISMMIDYDRPQSGFIKVDLTPLTMQLQSMQRSENATPQAGRVAPEPSPGRNS
ncbi:MAG: hypothetical protein JO104_06785 [Candidatus Eremiobacteraeota bacterium]|nr:hypothetical protein [Candidatus Eremiobacteraeota bacterium]